MFVVVTGDEEASAEISITSNLVNSAEFWRLFVLLCPSVSKVTLLIVQIPPSFVKKIRCFLDDKTETKKGIRCGFPCVIPGFEHFIRLRRNLRVRLVRFFQRNGHTLPLSGLQP